jgi:hypothetical protein
VSQSLILGDTEQITLALTSSGVVVDLAGATAVILGRRGDSTFSAAATISGGSVSCDQPPELTTGDWRLQAVVTFAGGAVRTYPNTSAFVPLRVSARVTA